MTQHHSHPPAVTRPGYRHFGLAQMGALGRLAIVVPAIAMIWLVLWLLVRS